MDSNPLASFALGGLGAQHGKMSDSDSDIEVLSPVAVLTKKGPGGKNSLSNRVVSKHFQDVNSKMAGSSFGGQTKGALSQNRANKGYRNTGKAPAAGGWIKTKKRGVDDKQIEKDANKAKKQRQKLSKKKKPKGKASPDGVDDMDEKDDEMVDFIIGSDEDEEGEFSMGSYNEGTSSEDDFDSPTPVKIKKKNVREELKKKMEEKKMAERKENETPLDTPDSGGLFGDLRSSESPTDLGVEFDGIETPKQAPHKGGRLSKKTKTKEVADESPSGLTPVGKPIINVDGSDSEQDIDKQEVDDMEDDEIEDADSEADDEIYEEREEAADLLKDVETLVHDIHAKVNKWSKVVVEGGALALDDATNTDDADWISNETISELCPSLKLAPYQLVGVNWLAMLSRQRWRGKDVNGIIGDEMGLGKTVQTIAFLRWFKEYGGLEAESGDKTEKVSAAAVSARKTFYDSDDEPAAPAPAAPPAPPVPTSKKVLEPHLIVVPASTLDNWEREFSKFAPDLEILKYHGSQAQRKEIQYELRPKMRKDSGHLVPDIVLTTFSYFSNEKPDDRNFLKRFQFNYLVVDEGHTLKNPEGARYKNLNKFKTKHRILLTGTPVQNNAKELMALLTFLMPLFKKPKRKSYQSDEDADDGGAKMLEHFVSINGEDGEGEDDGALGYQKLKTLLAPFILRRRKDMVLSQILPPKKLVVERVKLSESVQELYNDVIRSHTKAKAKLTQGLSKNIFVELRKVSNQPLLLRTRWTDDKSISTLTRWLRNSGFFGSDHTLSDDLIRNELAKMSDFAIHSACVQMMQEKPILTEHLNQFTLVEGDLFTSPKCTRLRTLLPDLVSKGHRILLFSQWKMNLDILQCLLESLGMKFHRLDGDLRVNERMQIIDSFNNDPSYTVFLLSTRAGGMGINLTSADTCIIHDCDFNPTMDQQAEDRCHRIGQKKPVTVYKLICEGTVDEGIYEVAERKTRANKALLNDGSGEEAGETGNEKKDISMLVSKAFQKFYESSASDDGKNLGGVAEAANAGPPQAKPKPKPEEENPEPQAPPKKSKIICLDSDSDTDDEILIN